MMVDGAPASVSSTEIRGSGRVVLFAVPGAFTAGCSKVHSQVTSSRRRLFLQRESMQLHCISVSDVFVMDAWGQTQGAGHILMLANPDAEFAKAVGLEVDASGFSLGIRAKQYALVLQDGVVEAFLPEEDGFSVMASTAACALAGL